MSGSEKTGHVMSGNLTVDLSSIVKGPATELVFTNAYLNNGSRSISGTLEGPGRLGACPFDRLSFSAGPYSSVHRNEPHVWMQRWTDERHWHAVTDKAWRAAVPLVARAIGGRFEQVWAELFAATKAKACAVDALDNQRRAKWAESWWSAAAEVARWMEDGVLEVFSAERDESGRTVAVDLPECKSGWWSTSHAKAACVLRFDNGEQAGWITEAGQIAPFGHPSLISR